MVRSSAAERQGKSNQSMTAVECVLEVGRTHLLVNPRHAFAQQHIQCEHAALFIPIEFSRQDPCSHHAACVLSQREDRRMIGTQYDRNSDDLQQAYIIRDGYRHGS